MISRVLSVAFVSVLLAAGLAEVFQRGIVAQESPAKGPAGKARPRWAPNDRNRPLPPVVTSAANPGDPPSDAVVLFDGKDLSKWRSDKGGPAKWKVADGSMEVNDTGSIVSTESFGDCQLHIEWMTPSPPKGGDQGRGNSGVFLMGRFEIQVLDSFENPTYADGTAASLYGRHPPLVNASRKPGEWQTYDVFFRTPRYPGGKAAEPGRLTLVHNGVLVHCNAGIRVPDERGPATGPIALQDHGDKQPVRFRNIWVRRLHLGEETDD